MELPRFSQVAEEVSYGFQLIGERKFTEAREHLEKGLRRVETGGFRTEIALFQSTLGFLEKAQGHLKEAWRWYEKAEKTLPDDPALKIIVARFLVEQFAQPEGAIKRAKRVLKLCPANASFLHHAYVTMGLAYLAKGEKKNALEMFDKSMEDDFAGLVSADSIDLHLVEAFVKRDWEMNRCRAFLEKGKRFAETSRNETALKTFDRLLASFEATAAG